MPRVRHPACNGQRNKGEKKERRKKKKESRGGENLTISIMPGMVVIAASCLFGDGSILSVVTMLPWPAR